MGRHGLRATAIAALLSIAWPATGAQAMSRDVKDVLTLGLYGIVAGTALGLATLPLAKSSRAIFIGSSVGLYLGLATGFYHITHRDDPGNPLRSDGGPRLMPPRALAEVTVPVLSF